MPSRFWRAGGNALLLSRCVLLDVAAALSAGAIAFDSGDGWATGQNPPAISITLPSDGSVQVGDWYRIEYASNSGFTGSAFGNWHQITSDDILNNNAVTTTYSWGVSTLPAGATWFRQYFGRGADAGHITLQSSASNVINDTLAAVKNLIQSANQPAPINNSYGAKVWTFSGVDFVTGGLPVVFLYGHDTNTISSVVVKGAGASGADISLVQRLVNTGGFGIQQMWVGPDGSPIVSAPGQQVVITGTTNASTIGVMCATLTGVSSGVPTATGVTNFASAASPVTAPAVTVAAGGLGGAFWTLNGASPYTANTGTFVASYANQLESGTNGAITKQLTSGSWTASLSYTGGTAASGALVAAWS